MSDTRLRQNVMTEASSLYRKDDRIVARWCAYSDVAIHQEGDGRSVYLTRKAALRFAFRLIRQVLRGPR